MTYFTASELGKKEPDVQVAILLNVAGPEAQEIHEQFQFVNDDDKKAYLKILDKFGDYCKTRKNVVYERYRFWSRNQIEDEPVDKWVKELRTIAADCEFKDQEDSMIRDKVVFGICDGRIKERMLRDTDLNLQKALDICRAAESTKSQMKEMAQDDMSSSSIHEMASFEKTGNGRKRETKEGDKRSCYRCGKVGHISPDCPSHNESTRNRRVHEDKEFNQTCYNCGGIGHFSKDCPSGDDFPRSKHKSRGKKPFGRGGYGRGRKAIHEIRPFPRHARAPVLFGNFGNFLKNSACSCLFQ